MINPSKATNVYWLFAKRKAGGYPAHTMKGGKWLIFTDIKYLDSVWAKIKKATEEGKLGEESKVSTAKQNPKAGNKSKKVICVYTYDHTDKEDVMRIREVLRTLGIRHKIPYKTDFATDRNEYQITGHRGISVYYE